MKGASPHTDAKTYGIIFSQWLPTIDVLSIYIQLPISELVTDASTFFTLNKQTRSDLTFSHRARQWSVPLARRVGPTAERYLPQKRGLIPTGQRILNLRIPKPDHDLGDSETEDHARKQVGGGKQPSELGGGGSEIGVLSHHARYEHIENVDPWGMDGYIRRFHESFGGLQCRQCHALLLGPEQLDEWITLPDDNWAEMMEFWHCHKPPKTAKQTRASTDTTAETNEDQCKQHGEEGNVAGKKDGEEEEEDKALRKKAYHASARFQVRPGVGYVGLGVFLIHPDDWKQSIKTHGLTKAQPSKENTARSTSDCGQERARPGTITETEVVTHSDGANRCNADNKSRNPGCGSQERQPERADDPRRQNLSEGEHEKGEPKPDSETEHDVQEGNREQNQGQDYHQLPDGDQTEQNRPTHSSLQCPSCHTLIGTWDDGLDGWRVYKWALELRRQVNPNDRGVEEKSAESRQESGRTGARGSDTTSTSAGAHSAADSDPEPEPTAGSATEKAVERGGLATEAQQSQPAESDAGFTIERHDLVKWVSLTLLHSQTFSGSRRFLVHAPAPGPTREDGDEARPGEEVNQAGGRTGTAGQENPERKKAAPVLFIQILSPLVVYSGIAFGGPDTDASGQAGQPRKGETPSENTSSTVLQPLTEGMHVYWTRLDTDSDMYKQLGGQVSAQTGPSLPAPQPGPPQSKPAGLALGGIGPHSGAEEIHLPSAQVLAELEKALERSGRMIPVDLRQRGELRAGLMARFEQPR